MSPAARTPPPPTSSHARPGLAADPLAPILKLGSHKHARTMTLAVLAALCVHGTAAARVAVIDPGLLAWARSMRMAINDKLASTIDIDVDKPKPLEPPPEVPKDEPKAEPKPVDKAPPVKTNEPPPKEATPPPPPAAAQAGAVLTAKPDDAPVDFTNSIVVGNGESYAGGVTQAQGTSTVAVRNVNAQAGGVPGGTGTAPAPVAPPGIHRGS